MSDAPAHLDELPSFQTLDGSLIRELAGPAWTAARAQSLAEATVPPGAQTAEHYHVTSEEIYYFVAGSGRVRLGEETFAIRQGHCLVIPPGTRHKLFNDDGERPLVLLCCCAPAYSDEDTVITER
jgi:mannose-6-phosphate isomerase-like protein (cupin superfamily)